MRGKIFSRAREMERSNSRRWARSRNHKTLTQSGDIAGPLPGFRTAPVRLLLAGPLSIRICAAEGRSDLLNRGEGQRAALDGGDIRGGVGGIGGADDGRMDACLAEREAQRKLGPCLVGIAVETQLSGI